MSNSLLGCLSDRLGKGFLGSIDLASIGKDGSQVDVIQDVLRLDPDEFLVNANGVFQAARLEVERGKPLPRVGTFRIDDCSSEPMAFGLGQVALRCVDIACSEIGESYRFAHLAEIGSRQVILAPFFLPGGLKCGKLPLMLGGLVAQPEAGAGPSQHVVGVGLCRVENNRLLQALLCLGEVLCLRVGFSQETPVLVGLGIVLGVLAQERNRLVDQGLLEEQVGQAVSHLA